MKFFNNKKICKVLNILSFKILEKDFKDKIGTLIKDQSKNGINIF